jgi:Coenzyme PQQ synthesis protein D (PqqD)
VTSGADSFVRDEAVLWRRVVDGVLLLPPGSDELMLLTGSGGEIWHALERPCSATELAGVLADRYDVTEQQLLTQVLPSTLDELERRRAVRRVVAG